jgi:anti-sigma regulatory factor (Ser/Thr protein kinase)
VGRVPGPRPVRYSHSLPKVAASAASARRVIDGLSGSLDPTVLSNARLLVSELVANAVEHVPEDGRIGLEVALTGGVLHVAVTDPGHGFIPRPRLPEAPRNSGWGLHFVSLLADRWAVAAEGAGQVWFELDASAARAS